MDLYDDAKEYRVVLEVAGTVREEVETSPGPVEGTLSVRIKRGKSERPSGQPLLAERSTGPVRYERLIPVARDADVAKAHVSVDNGLLTIVVPKRAAETQEKKQG